MRALTVRQPWAWAIIHGGKDIENRTRNLAGTYRGPVAIHAGLRYDAAACECEHPMAGLLHPPCPREARADHNRHHCVWCRDIEPRKHRDHGHIIGVADLVDVHFNDTRAERWDAEHERNATCSPWAEHGPVWHLQLANARPLAEPIPCRGRLGLWTVPDDIARLIEEAD